VPRAEWEQNGDKIKNGIAGGFASYVEDNRDMIIAPMLQDKRFSADYNHNRYISNIKANGKLITNEDGTGAYLLDQFGNYVMVDTQDKGRQPLFFTWNALSNTPPPTGLRPYNQYKFRPWGLQ
jgi:hypothetical protein